jgi:hypothetical protein
MTLAELQAAIRRVIGIDLPAQETVSVGAARRLRRVGPQIQRRIGRR